MFFILMSEAGKATNKPAVLIEVDDEVDW